MNFGCKQSNKLKNEIKFGGRDKFIVESFISVP